ncbi:MAG TPA: hypothetical protein VGS58_12345, partial [Candidatus Sulfopaludibacter sp.]|nr:hypothetical protein [Candidatus Sulfopaludibacter sp.]
MSAPAQDSLGAIRQTAPMPGLRLDLVDEEASLLRLDREWQCLLSQMARPSPFLSFPWITTWWRHFGRGSRLFIVIARGPGGELVGAAPLHIVPRRLAGIVTVRSLEFIGYRGSAVCADHLDFLTPANARAAVTAALMQELLQRREEWDALVLADLAEESQVPAALSAVAPALCSRLETAETCFYRGLPASAEELWADIRRFHPKLASNVKYYRKRLQQRHQVQWVAPVPAVELDSTLEALARLHGLAHGRKDETGNFGRPEYRAFHQELIRALASDRALYL